MTLTLLSSSASAHSWRLDDETFIKGCQETTERLEKEFAIAGVKLLRAQNLEKTLKDKGIVLDANDQSLLKRYIERMQVLYRDRAMNLIIGGGRDCEPH